MRRSTTLFRRFSNKKPGFVQTILNFGLPRNYSFNNNFSGFQSTARTFHNYLMPTSLVTEISTAMREENYSTAKKTLSSLTQNKYGTFRYRNQNQLALYLHSLLLLETRSMEEMSKPLVLSCDCGFEPALLLRASLSYLKLDPNITNGKYALYLTQCDKTIDWCHDEEKVKSALESYLISLVNEFDSSFANMALGKFYIKTEQFEKGMQFLNKAVERENKMAKLEKAILLRNGTVDGIIEKNSEESFKLFRECKFIPKAHDNYIEMLRSGEGTRKNLWKAFMEDLLFWSYTIARHAKLNAIENLRNSSWFEIANFILFLIITILIWKEKK